MASTHSACIDFLKAGLELRIGFARLSQTERKLRAPEAAEKAALSAEQAYNTFIRFRPLVGNLTEADESTFERLETALRDGLSGLRGVEEKMLRRG